MTKTQKTYQTSIADSLSLQKILLVDDDEDEHEIFLSALKNVTEDFRFMSAISCEDALKILTAVVPDFIFLDLNMPRINGIKTLEEIRKIKALTAVPVYIYSTGINEKDGKKAISLGAEDYIVKPNSIGTLSTILKQLLN